MILNNKIAHEWMNEYVTKINALKTANQNELLAIMDKANQYKFRLVEILGEDEFNKQIKNYADKYNRVGFLK